MPLWLVVDLKNIVLLKNVAVANSGAKYCDVVRKCVVAEESVLKLPSSPSWEREATSFRRRLMRLQTFNVVDAIIIFSLPARLDGLGFIDPTDHPLHFFVLSSV